MQYCNKKQQRITVVQKNTFAFEVDIQININLHLLSSFKHPQNACEMSLCENTNEATICHMFFRKNNFAFTIFIKLGCCEVISMDLKVKTRVYTSSKNSINIHVYNIT